jgi:predicted  nucleic acid-binding Zn-ribbon protein
MDVKDYCNNVQMELNTWKARLYDVMRRVDNLSTGEKQHMYGSIEDLHILLTELNDRVEQLRSECPTEWSPQREEIKIKVDDLQKRAEQMEKELFDYTLSG